MSRAAPSRLFLGVGPSSDVENSLLPSALSHTQWTSLPSDVENSLLPSALSHTQWTSLPSDLENSLLRSTLSHRQWTSLPSDLENSLLRSTLSHRQWTSLPSDVENSLLLSVLSHRQWTSLPSDVENSLLPSALSHTQWTSLPSDVENSLLPSALSHTQWTSLPSDVENSLLPSALSHTQWTSLLKAYVDQKGLVNYQQWKQNPQPLAAYLSWLSTHMPSPRASREEKIAYWINLYNAHTVALVLEHYPIASIKDIEVNGSQTPWDIPFIELPMGTLSLNEVEHNILRKQFKEPRIHFALVCAAMSCPPLRREAYVADRLDEQLDEQARRFLRDPTKNQFSGQSARISSIFKWFAEDFAFLGPLSEYLSRYAGVPISSNSNIDYMTYDWQLNQL